MQFTFTRGLRAIDTIATTTPDRCLVKLAAGMAIRAEPQTAPGADFHYNLIMSNSEAAEIGLRLLAGSEVESQEAAEIVAALRLGNSRLASPAVEAAIASIGLFLAADKTHYMFVRDPDDLASFFGCGTASGAAATMEEDRATFRLYALPREECPDCREPAADDQ